jgi:2-aminoadipate transaminase
MPHETSSVRSGARQRLDATYLQTFLSESARHATRSEIRELLKVLARPEVISLAGGLPDPATFPVEDLARLMGEVVSRHGNVSLQYGPTEGDLGLRQELVGLMAADGVDGLTPDHVLITSASQQGLDLCGRVFLAPGDAVVLGLPTYLGALGAFTACGAQLSGIPLDDLGMRTDLLEARLVDLRRQGTHPKLLYVVPDFENPAGVTLSRRRRWDLLSLARDFDLLVVEDSPYRQLRYRGEHLPSLLQMDQDGRVISLRTFSKILFPGLRVGWVVADPEVVSRLVVAKQPVDLCTSPFAQVVAREYLKTGRLASLIAATTRLYATKCEAMLGALERHIDPAWGVRWTRPEGGLFLFVTLPVWMDASKLLMKALTENVAFVSGGCFHCDKSGKNTLRLNFSYPPADVIVEGVRRLARVLAAAVAEGPGATRAPAAPAVNGAQSLVRGDHSLAHLSWNLAVTEVVG